MTPSKRKLTGPKINAVFVPSVTLQTGDSFAVACQYNDKRRLNEYFYIDIKTEVAYLISHVTYDRLVDQSKPI